MGDYIDRECLKEAIREDAINCLSCYNGEVLDLVLMEIDEATAADVRPVVRGRWLCETEIEGHACGECSVCHKIRVIDNFCPSCGADMRGE